VTQDYRAELARMAGFSTSLGWTGAEDRTPRETMFSPIMSFLAFSRATTNCSLSGCPLVKTCFWIRACAFWELLTQDWPKETVASLTRHTR